MTAFISAQFSAILAKNKLNTFEKIWDLEVDWLEEPNYRRGGWSGVSYLELLDEYGQKNGFYLKRQDNYMRKTLQNPFSGEPTFLREYKMLRFLEISEVITPNLAFFERNRKQSILMTAALTDYLSVDCWFAENNDVAIKQKYKVISAMANAVRLMHRAGLQHRALYLKHLFIQPMQDTYQVAVIDLEKARVRYFILFYRYTDLRQLLRRSRELSCKQKLHFFKYYFDIKRLNYLDKKLFAYLNR